MNEPLDIKNLLPKTTVEFIDHINELTGNLKNLVVQYNKVANQKQVIENIAVEYLYSKISELSPHDNKSILLSGCEATIKKINTDIDFTINRLNKISKCWNGIDVKLREV